MPNNNKINDNLSQQLKMIYDYWFLQFEFPNEEGKPYKSSGGKMIYKEELPHVQWKNYYEVNIEHIMPQNYGTNWKAEMDDYLNDKKLDSDRENMAKKILINTLGNLTILKDKKNSSLQDDSWELKRIRYESGSFNELEISRKDKWNQFTIMERGRNMVHFLETMISGLKFSDEEIMALLFVKEDYYVKES